MNEIFYIDLFSGAGGTTTGIHLSSVNAKVVACVNHDSNAIKSHKREHPECLHFVEDVRDMAVVKALKTLCDNLRRKHPSCIIIIWASLECTNFSIAKGGLPRDADSRTLAYSMYDYVQAINPDYLMIENVREFMSWGPLDSKGKPISKHKGRDYVRWVYKIKSFGYNFDWVMLNSADFGAYTSRNRYFCQFAKGDLPIAWPKQTHSKKSKSQFEPLQKWMEVKDVLDLDNEGESIFNRKKPFVDSTLERIYAGLVKFVANGETEFLNKNYSGHPDSKVISTKNPAGTITCVDHHSLIKAKMLTSYYGNTKGATGVNTPCPTVTTKDRFRVVFIDQQYGNSKPSGVNSPMNTLTANPKFNVISTNWLLNPQYKSKGSSLYKPCFTLIARMDKSPPYLMSATKGNNNIVPLSTDSEIMIKIKEFMLQYGISDIKSRLLTIVELLKIQGFPANYTLIGNQAEQKKFIGNAVVPLVAKKICEANAQAINQYLKYSLGRAL